MSVALLVFRDGRDGYHEESLASAREHLPWDMISQEIVVDDREHQLGYAGAIAEAWRQVDRPWVFHLEADFTFNEPVPLAWMIATLEEYPEVAQIVLKRQAWNREERLAGGIVELHPDDFEDQVVATGARVTSHRRFWSTNPCVYSSRWCTLGWPQQPQSEGIFTHRLLDLDKDLQFAFWGGKFDAPRVHHIGDERAGTGY